MRTGRKKFGCWWSLRKNLSDHASMQFQLMLWFVDTKIKFNTNLKEYDNCFIGSKVTANEIIYPINGAPYVFKRTTFFVDRTV